ncbi:MAG: UDP-N-acetylglucosamine 2-epimerase (non-hydrolyzing) [Ignavibacteriales bacterium]|nr:UDP-N-acetylglucosamine 2-epimerase (non-hydrolyzing) [Ignavibacteriales bacterium]
MLKVLIIAGTRPEIIKIAPILLKAKENSFSKKVNVKFCFTGQHKTMAKEAMEIFGIAPDANLELMKPNQTLNDISQSVFECLPKVLDEFSPDCVLVQGDTTTAAISALCTLNIKISIGHIEAGLRSFNLASPFPEEANRKIISAIASYNFCPTENAKQNLLRESVAEKSLFVTGNTIVDAIKIISKKHKLDNVTSIHSSIRKPFILITAHRRESFGEGFQNICEAIKDCAEKFSTHQFIYPVHLNPNVKEPVYKLLKNLSNVLLIEPISYLRLLTLLKHCEFVLTDSGGIQEEAPSFGKYCIVMREVTERMESVKMKMSELVGTNKEKIVFAVAHQISHPKVVSTFDNPYGDGNSSQRILEIISAA